MGAKAEELERDEAARKSAARSFMVQIEDTEEDECEDTAGSQMKIDPFPNSAFRPKGNFGPRSDFSPSLHHAFTMAIATHLRRHYPTTTPSPTFKLRQILHQHPTDHPVAASGGAAVLRQHEASAITTAMVHIH